MTLWSETAVQELFETLDRETKDLDISLLFNCAGAAHSFKVQNIQFWHIQKVYSVNVFATYFISQYFVKRSIERFEKHKKRSAAVFISSMSTQAVFP